VVGVSANGRRLAPDALIPLGEWELTETGECVEVVCAVMRSLERCPGDGEPVEIVRPELAAELRLLVWFVLDVWGQARGLGA
jgi:hypothetical protein